MPELSIANMPEVFVSNTEITKAVYDAVEAGRLRKIGTRLYTRKMNEDPERLVRRNWYHLITGYYPDAIIADRTALENGPAEDGSVFLISNKMRKVSLPGLTFQPRKGAAALESDKPFAGGARLSSPARAYLENMKLSRARAGGVARTLSSEEMENHLDRYINRQGEQAINRLRDEARDIAPALGLDDEFEQFNNLIGALIGTQDGKIEGAVGKARAAGQPFDTDRLSLFEKLFFALHEIVPESRPPVAESDEAIANVAFFESYFSNFIEGTKFTVEEAQDIIFKGSIPEERPNDAHDVLGTFRIVSDEREMRQLPKSFEDFIEKLRARHATVMSARPEKNPGVFKAKNNQAGNTIFVLPDLVEGTLKKGFEFLEALPEPFQRAVFAKVLISEVHPFSDGNGRIARIMMNAELIAGNQERILIPTAYRTDYLSSLKALSHNNHTTPTIRTLDVAQNYTRSIDWNSFAQARAMLDATNAFEEGEHAKLDWSQAAVED